MVAAFGIDGQGADDLAGGAVDDADVVVVDEEDDGGSVVASADGDVVELTVDAEADVALADAVAADPELGADRRFHTSRPRGEVGDHDGCAWGCAHPDPQVTGMVGCDQGRTPSDPPGALANITTGLRYLPAVARRLHHCSDIGEPFDFLTWFEYAPGDAARFEELVGRLRASEEWSYVDREVDIRIAR